VITLQNINWLISASSNHKIKTNNLSGILESDHSTACSTDAPERSEEAIG